MSMTRLVSNVT
ncbi:hypothetical protein MAR_035929 [Mya arenaria]|uniref:Uncharacterized protein n=1 Tax=Mya arenaria TaxID=6604 RepID=A0ABY7EQJ9_MYAAR|nr:hypothetical protein MAR_035929 [Mya arenaria]